MYYNYNWDEYDFYKLNHHVAFSFLQYGMDYNLMRRVKHIPKKELREIYSLLDNKDRKKFLSTYIRCNYYIQGHDSNPFNYKQIFKNVLDAFSAYIAYHNDITESIKVSHQSAASNPYSTFGSEYLNTYNPW